MDSKQVMVFGLGIVCALTLAVAATALQSSGAAAGGSGPTVGVDSGLIGDLLSNVQFSDWGSLGAVMDLLVYVPGTIVLALVVRQAIQSFGADKLLTGSVFLLLGAIAFVAFPLAIPDQPLGSGGFSAAVESVDDATQAAPEYTILLTPIVGMLALVGGLGVGVVVLTRSESPEDPSVEPTDVSGPREVETLAAAAGRAAEELETSESFENAVYRAWREMVDSLPVEDPETTTPGEFETAAIEAGMSPSDVRELTGLFETVRYGQTPVSEQRQQRAKDALRRIEEAQRGGDP